MPEQNSNFQLQQLDIVKQLGDTVDAALSQRCQDPSVVHCLAGCTESRAGEGQTAVVFEYWYEHGRGDIVIETSAETVGVTWLGERFDPYGLGTQILCDYANKRRIYSYSLTRDGSSWLWRAEQIRESDGNTVHSYDTTTHKNQLARIYALAAMALYVPEDEEHLTHDLNDILEL